MDLHFIWKSIVIVFGGVLILRWAGRKSISQLTVAQTVMMVALGSLIIQPVGNNNIWITMIITIILVLTLIFIEKITLRFDYLESFFYGKSIIVVENGTINENNLKKIRLTVDMLEVRLRQQSIQKIEDLEWATIEPNGQLGYMLKVEKQYATKEDIQILLEKLDAHTPADMSLEGSYQTSTTDNIFKEIKQDLNTNEQPEHLK